MRVLASLTAITASPNSIRIAAGSREASGALLGLRLRGKGDHCWVSHSFPSALKNARIQCVCLVCERVDRSFSAAALKVGNIKQPSLGHAKVRTRSAVIPDLN